jgi:Trm5-related predicted tRNA methylase
MEDKEYESLIKEIKKKRLDVKIKKIVTTLRERKQSEETIKVKLELFQECCRLNDYQIDINWAMRNIFGIK